MRRHNPNTWGQFMPGRPLNTASSRSVSLRRRWALGIVPIEASSSNGVPGAVGADRAGRRPAGRDRLRNARAIHRHGTERPGSSVGQRSDREGVAARFGAGNASTADLTHRRVLPVGDLLGRGAVEVPLAALRLGSTCMDFPPFFRIHLNLIGAAFNLGRTIGLHQIRELTSHDLTRFFKVKTRAAGEELGRIAVAEVAEEV